jgi:hypothetical protein
VADVAVTEPLTLVLRYADVGIATYASLRIVGQPERTVTWVIEETILLAALAEIAAAVPDPRDGETVAEALARALGDGPFTAPERELGLAYRLGVLLIGQRGWDLLTECVTAPRAVLFVAPSARLGHIPWGLLAKPAMFPVVAEMLAARTEAVTAEGPTAARIPWPPGELAQLTEGYRLMELVDVLMAVPVNIAASRRRAHPGAGDDALLILDPRIPGQRPDSALGSVLGRPAPDTLLARHYAPTLDRVLPPVAAAVELFRRTDSDRDWLAAMLAQRPGRLVFVGHASAADQGGQAEHAALHLADHRPLTASDLMASGLVMPPRVALLACASGGDYRFDEATGLVAAMVLAGAELVTATLWSLPTTAGYRKFTGADGDPMAETVTAVDTAHRADTVIEAGRAVNRWQRDQMRRWRGGDVSASPVYWAALATFALSQAGGTQTATADSSR